MKRSIVLDHAHILGSSAARGPVVALGPVVAFGLAVAVLSAFTVPDRPVAAHFGPPFPVAVDQAVGAYRIDVWADPDVGTGTFWIVIDSPAVDPAATTVEVSAEPVGGAGTPATVAATWAPLADADGERRWEAAVPLDREGEWSLTVRIDGAPGSESLTVPITATPWGPTAGEAIGYSIPFVALAVFWLAAWRRIGRAKREGRAAR